MGESKHRRQRLGEAYGTPIGSNKPKPCESIVIYRSAWTGKWAVGLKVSSTELRCLDVFYDRKMAEQDAIAARKVFSAYTWSDIMSGERWEVIIKEYICASESLGIQSDDEVLGSNRMVRTPDQWNAELREMNLISDNVWHRRKISL